MRSARPPHPLLYEVNAAVWLGAQGRARGEGLTLAEIPAAELARLAERGVDLLWLMGVWERGRAGRSVALEQAWLQETRRRLLPDGGDEDIVGSPYAVAGYEVAADLGGPGALAALRERLAAFGIGLILDFVPNHTALDHPWVRARPELYVQGSEDDLARHPEGYFRVDTARGARVLAHGRDPYFPPWTDTAQLHHGEAATRASLLETLHSIASRCDGVRCDMAMLPLAQVFTRTWGPRARARMPADGSLWEEAIPGVRERYPSFIFIAEAYWGLEGALQERGFDFTYDKRLYDRLRSGDLDGLRTHLEGAPEFQRRCARFLENHDEERAARAFPGSRQSSAALAAFTLPGLRLLHEGQAEGHRARIPVQLRRRPLEEDDPVLAAFYGRLLGALREPALREGTWRLLEVRPAWPDNPTWRGFFAWEWRHRSGARRWVVLNLGPTRGQCFVAVPTGDLPSPRVLLRDLLGPTRHQRDREDLGRRGLYLDLDTQQGHLFEVMAELEDGAGVEPRRSDGSPAGES